MEASIDSIRSIDSDDTICPNQSVKVRDNFKRIDSDTVSNHNESKDSIKVSPENLKNNNKNLNSPAVLGESQNQGALAARRSFKKDRLPVENLKNQNNKENIPTPRRDETKSADVYKKKIRKQAIQKANSRQGNQSSTSHSKSNLDSTSHRAQTNMTRKGSRLNFNNLENIDLDNLLRSVNSASEQMCIMDNSKIWKFHLLPHFNFNLKFGKLNGLRELRLPQHLNYDQLNMFC